MKHVVIIDDLRFKEQTELVSTEDLLKQILIHHGTVSLQILSVNPIRENTSEDFEEPWKKIKRKAKRYNRKLAADIEKLLRKAGQ